MTQGPGSDAGLARRLLAGTSWQALANLAPLVINLGLTPYLIHGLGTERYSVFLLVASVIALLGAVDGGVGPSAQRYFTIYAGQRDPVATTRLLTSVGAIVAVAGAALVVLAFAASDHILRWFRVTPELFAEAELLLRTMVVVIAVLQLRNLFQGLVLAHNRFGTLALGVLTGYVVYATVMVMAVHWRWGLGGVAVALVLQQVAASCFQVPVGLTYLVRAGVGRPAPGVLRDFFGYAWRAQVGGLVQLAASQKDQLVAGRLLTAQESGPFGQGTNFSLNLRYLPQNAIGPIQAVIGQGVGRSGADATVPTVQKVQRVWVRAVAGWFGIGIPATWFGVRAWLPDTYHAAASVAAILLVGHFFHVGSRVLALWALTVGHPEIEMRAGVAGLVVNLAVSAALYPVLGMIGVVVGSAAGGVTAGCYLMVRSSRTPPVRIRAFVRDVPLAPLVVCMAFCLGCEHLVADHLPEGVLGLLGAALAAVPAAGVYAGMTVRRDDLRRLWGSRA